MLRINVMLVLALTSLLGCQQWQAPTQSKQTANPTLKQYSAEAFFETTTVYGSAINHSGNAVLVTSDASGVFNAYKYPVDGSQPTQLTHSTTNAISGVSWFPKDDRILYTSDGGGNELNHLYVLTTDGKATDITPGDNLKAGFYGWHRDEQHFFVTTNERDPKAMDLYQYNADDFSRELLFENTGALSLSQVSDNGRWLVLQKINSNADDNLFVVDLTSADKKPVLITPHSGSVSYRTYTFTRDNQRLIFGSNQGSEYVKALSYNLANGEVKAEYSADWDVSFLYYSKHGRYRVVGINADAQTKLAIQNRQTGKSLSIPGLPAGDLRGVNFSKDENTMVFYINSDTSPSNLYTYKIGDTQIRKLTDTLNPTINPNDLVSSEIVRFKSFDGLSIPNVLYKPQQASANNKVPAIVFVHGGPGGQTRKGYRAMMQHLVNHGYGILGINNRGSSGYGKTFYHLDDKRHGEDDLQDVVYGKKYLQSLPWVDPDKIVVMGGSYGGYMTMAAMAFTDEFKLGINIFGVTNWVRTLESIPPWWESFRQSLYDELGDPATDKERLYRISPLFHADKVKKPVLIVQGANDPRVLQVESDEMVAAIKANNIPVEYVLFEDEGHGFRKKANRVTAQKAYLKFLQTYLQ